LTKQLQSLLQDIESCRLEMIRIACENSLQNHKVIETSKKLDGLLNRYYLLSSKK
jgi:hypothetical protein